MDIAVTGSTGLIGSALVERLRAEGHHVIRFVRPGSSDRGRSPDDDTAEWDPTTGTIDLGALEGLDGVVHLAGAGIADSRWTPAQKDRILSSRRRGTTLLAATLAALARPPAVLLSASAIGYYGDTGDRPTDESGEAGDDFPAQVCRVWERCTAPAAEAGIPVAHLRTGIVLDPHGGALAKQLPFFRWGFGGRSGSGRQFQSWITLRDEVGAIVFLLERAVAARSGDGGPITGPVNLVAPEPVRNAELASTLGRVLGRPTTIIPMIGPRALYGRELADSLLLTSQRIVCRVLTEAGYGFRDPELEPALRAMLGR
jgi:uncharacterized protein (TIGR01777 family)